MVAFILAAGLTHHAVYIAGSVAAGFGLGRVKNQGKLAAIKAELVSAETSTVAEVKILAAKIKSKL
jgi:hypothetical protein